MALTSNLKPFNFNLADVEYVLAQVNFRPLFDANHNALIAWDGTGPVYDYDGNQLADQGSAAANVAAYGTSYAHVTASQGIRTISGVDNNLLLTNNTWGAADAEFVRTLGINYTFADQQYDSGATRPVDLGAPLPSGGIDEAAHLANANTDLGPTPISSTTTTATSTDGLFTEVTGSALAGGLISFNYTIQYFGRTTTEIIAETHVIDGGREFVSWKRIDTTTAEHTDLIVVDALGERVEQIGASSINTLVGLPFMIGGELDTAYHSFTAQQVQDSIAQGYNPTSVTYSAGVNGGATVNTDVNNGGDVTPLVDGSLTPDQDADVRKGDVIDYTPRMISQTITTGDVEMLTVKDLFDQATIDSLGLDRDHIVYNTPFLNDGITANPNYKQGQDPNAANFELGAIEGIALVKDYGQLGALGIDDHQNPNNGESFIGSINPGVAPTNGFFAIFGQFFDHGLDFIAKNGQTDAGETAKIKIALAVDDPLYGVVGPSGRPTTEITITRATPTGIDENGNVRYVNHTSPFVDQSQSYGSHDQVGALLREWVEDPNNLGSFIMGTELVDSNTLANSWTRWDGIETNQTLVSVSTLRQHMIETGRDDLSWEDIGDLRLRDDAGQVVAGTSGHALLLDMNPRFEEARLRPNDGDTGTVWDANATTKVDAAVGTLNTNLSASITTAPNYATLNPTRVGTGDSFSLPSGGELTLTLGEDLVIQAGPNTMTLPAGAYAGASALALWVDFSDFTIAVPATGPTAFIHDAVSDILLASVGDHYLSGDGRVNENVALTSIHHVFHEEHNFQVANIQEWVLRHDDNANDGHVLAEQWMTEVTVDVTTLPVPATPDPNVSFLGGRYEANTSTYLASDENGDIYVTNVAPGGALPTNHSFIRTPSTVDAQGNPQPGDPISADGLLTRADGYLSWDQEKMFQAARLVVETEYNHVATDQFAGAITPDIGEFVGYNSGRDASIALEFGQAAYRYGHSTLRETIEVVDPDGGLSSRVMSYALEAAFLKPELYAELGPDALILGQTRQQMNEVDEFITPALNQGLLNLPLDLAAINIARGRDVGLPTFNEMREALGFNAYRSWADYGSNMQNADSLVNFMAAYAWDGNVDLAQAILDAAAGDGTALASTALIGEIAAQGGTVPFTNGDAAGASTWANLFMSGDANTFHSDTVNLIDAWIGGLGEVHVNGGLLGATFNAIFVDQIAALKDGDRFYYLYRLFGENLDEEIKAEQFKDIVERTTGTTNLNGNVFGYSEEYQNNKLVATWKTDDTLGSEVYLYNADGDVVVGPGEYFDPGVTYYNAGGTIGGVVTAIATKVDLYSDPAATTLAYAAGDPVPLTEITSQTVFYDANGQFVGADQHKYGQIIDAHAGDANGLNLDGSTNVGIGIYSDGGASTAGNGTLMDFDALMGAGTQKFIRDIRAARDVSDQLDGEPGSGADAHEVLVGTNFDDVIFARAGDDTVYGEGGNDLIFGGNGGDFLYGGDGHDEIHGGDGPEVIDGGAGDDWIYGDSSESAAGGTDLLIGGDGNDVVIDYVGINAVSLNGGDDVFLGSSDTDPFTRAGDGNDYLDGRGSGDILNGDGGDDLVVGGDDQDIVEGNDGDDILRPGRPSQALGGGPDEVLGGDGITDTGFDLLELNDYDASPVGETIDLDNQANPLVALDGITPKDSMTQVEGVIGSQNDDTLIGNTTIGDGVANTFNNWLIGGSGSDTFQGKFGDDVIVGGSIRLDALIGQYEIATNPGVRADYASYDVYEAASHRVDPNAALTDGVLGVAGFEKHFTQFLKSDKFKDYVLGNSEAVFDPLNPEAAGSGTAVADLGTDTAMYSGNRADYTITQVSFPGLDAYKIVDNRPFDPQTGLLLADGVTIGDGTDLLLGIEEIKFADITLAMAAFGNSLATGAAVINGFATANVQGFAPEVFPFGPLTADTTTIADADGLGTFAFQWQRSTDGGVTWTDIVGETSNQYQALTADLGAELRSVVSYTDGAGIQETLISAPTDIVGEYLRDVPGNNPGELQGDVGQDILIGLAGNDQLQGNDGNDWLNGGGGADQMQGGAGDDTYIVNSVNDTVSEGGDGGVDTVRASVNHTLAANVENLTLTGALNRTGTGNDLDNVITGNSGNNRLEGGAGNDTLDGGIGGVDTVRFSGPASNYAFLVDGADNVTVTDQVGTDGTDHLLNIDRVQFNGSGPNYQLSTLVNGSNGTAAGTNGRDVIVGADGDDNLSGGNQNDIVFGGAGDDTITWNAGDDRDMVDGGSNGAAGDTFKIVGNNTTEQFDIYTNAYATANAGYTGAAEIVIYRNNALIAELNDIEELLIDATTVSSPGNDPLGGTGTILAPDTITIAGDFNPTSLNFDTITIHGTEGNDTINISDLASEHRIVYHSNGGNDTIIGDLRPQDVVEYAPGLTAADYGAPQYDGNGMWTITQIGGGHSISYAGAADMAPPTFATATTTDASSGDDNADAGQADDQSENGQDDGGTDTNTSQDDDNGSPYVAALSLTGDADNNTLVGNTNGDILAGLDGDDVLLAGGGDNVVYAGSGNDEVISGSGNDVAFGGAGDDLIITGGGDDIIDGGTGRDLIEAGDGDDLILARLDDGNDVYNGGVGNDTINLSAITGNATVDLGIGRVSSTQSGSDTIRNFENVVGGQGDDRIIANEEVNVLTGGYGSDTFEFRSASAANNDRITDFELGDSVNLSGIFGGQDVSFMEGLTFAPGGQVLVYSSGDDAIIEGDVDNDGEADFAITLVGRADLGDFTG